MNVLVSLGELIDKLSILELKRKKINDPIKLVEIEKEINQLNVDKIYTDCFYYDILLYINEEIWDMTDNIKKMNYLENPLEFAKISNDIFQFNQKRFRIKNIFNTIYFSSIKEQKSYNNTCCKIILNSKEEVYNKIKEINYLSIDYDYILFEANFELTFLENIFETPNFIINNKITIKSRNNFNWENYIKYYKDLIPAGINTEESALEHFNKCGKNEKRYGNIVIEDCVVNYFDNIINISDNIINNELFDFKPINYINGGLLGDFINGLGVIYEYYYKYGRKGNLYIANQGDPFRMGLEYTYKDTYDIIKNQFYIVKYEIYSSDKKIDVDLVQWRYCINNIIGQRYDGHYSYVYGINWGLRKWLFNVDTNNIFSDRVLINTTSYRFPNTQHYTLLEDGRNTSFEELYSKYGDKLLYIGDSIEEYNYFKEQSGLEIEHYKPLNFTNLCIAINSCKLIAGSYSAPLTIAAALNVIRIPDIYTLFYN